MNYIDLLNCDYILWIDCGMDGWKPNGFNDLNLLPKIIKLSYGSDTILTKQIKNVKIKEK